MLLTILFWLFIVYLVLAIIGIIAFCLVWMYDRRTELDELAGLILFSIKWPLVLSAGLVLYLYYLSRFNTKTSDEYGDIFFNIIVWPFKKWFKKKEQEGKVK